MSKRDEALRAAVAALRSYQYGNAAPELAQEVADAGEAALAEAEAAPPERDPPRLNLSAAARTEISEDPELLSMLYDLDLLPEQLLSQHGVTPGLVAAFNQLYGVMYAHRGLVTPLRGQVALLRAAVAAGDTLRVAHEEARGVGSCARLDSARRAYGEALEALPPGLLPPAVAAGR